MLEQTGDRLEEAHHHLHAMERFYHHADEFRWSLNSFLRSTKEVPQILSSELEHQPEFHKWIREERKTLRADPLLSHLSKTRDFLVHRGMLIPRSSGFVGTADSRGLTFGLNMSILATENSDDALRGYIAVAERFDDPVGVLYPDNSSVACVQREWKMDPFEEDLLKLAADAWHRLGDMVSRVAHESKVDHPPIRLSCLHPVEGVQIKRYSHDLVWRWYKELGGKLEHPPA